MNNIFFIFLVAIFFYGCSSGPRYTQTSTPAYPSKTLSSSPDIYKKNGDLHATMRPYTVFGKQYYPTVVRVGDTHRGEASWYGKDFHAKSTSNGERYDMYAMTAAHKTFPMNTVVRVTNLNNNSIVVVRINDRGPFVANRIIDLSYAAAQRIGLDKSGIAPVTVEVLGFDASGSKDINIAKLSSGPKEAIIGSFFVQIGSFSRIEGALETKNKYNSFNGYNTIIKDTEVDGKRLFRVWLGEFKSDAEARDFISKGHFRGAYIIRE